MCPVGVNNLYKATVEAACFFLGSRVICRTIGITQPYDKCSVGDLNVF